MMNKLTFVEYIFREYNEEYDSIEEVEDDLRQMLLSDKHDDDCTKQNYSCQLCLLSMLLNEYYKYIKL